ncbi:hypothetical protein [Nocardioides sp. Iso805N]|uniref:hypothetical protein n=1 Tax=Nocardioides sp. Iso805N TaxID=1283287 RepID=UPI0012FB1D51|nr:hypothetical protein [Nocardioides sp. Iso805N]
MRATLSSLLTGVLLTVAVVVVIGVSSALDLEIEPYALAGVLAGGIVALIPDRSAWSRLAAFAIGFVAVWIGFVLRAALLPDTEGGRAAGAVVTLLICLVAVALGRSRLPLSAMLLGVALFSAAYEAAFVANEPEVASTSLDAATALIFAVAVGFAVAVVASGRRVPAESREAATDDAPGVPLRSTRPRRRELTDTAATNTEVTR